MRAALKALVTKLLVTDGLAERELAYVPKEVAVAVVGRLAAAAGIDLSKVVVRRNTSPGRPLKEWAMEPAKQWQPSYKETRLDRTPEGWKAEIELEARAAKMAAWFDKNPHATLADYSADLEAFERTADHAFWQAMDEMIEQGDLSSMAGRPSLGHGGGGRAYATSPVQPRPVATPAPAAPPATRAAAPAPAPARAARPLPTAWEIVSSRGAYDFFAAKARGYQGSFNDFRSR
jgi:hypothetical protein